MSDLGLIADYDEEEEENDEKEDGNREEDKVNEESKDKGWHGGGDKEKRDAVGKDNEDGAGARDRGNKVVVMKTRRCRRK